MYKVKIDGSTVSLVDINHCIEKLEKILFQDHGNYELTISAEREIEAFDQLLIAYLLAYHSRIRKLKVIIELPYNSSRTSGRNSNVAYQLYQCRTFAYISTKYVIYDLVFQDRTLKQDLNWEKLIDFGTGMFVFSSKFFPVLLVDDDTKKFDQLFRTSLHGQLMAKGISTSHLRNQSLWDSESSKVKSNLHGFLKKTSSPLDPENSFLNLAYMYFIFALDQAKIASVYFSENLKVGSGGVPFTIGDLDIEDSKNYYKQVSFVFSELEHSSIFHQFMFATLMSDDELRTIGTGKLVLQNDNFKLWVSKITNIWDFVQDLVAGIIELAKNIMEHCSPEPGAISVRILSLENWMKIKAGVLGQEGFYQSYKDRLISERFGESWSLVEVNVVDLGRKGIVKKLMENTSAMVERTNEGKLKGLLLEDLISLEQREVTFSNFLDTSKRQLNQQSKRSIAHFGLLTLSRLITFNNGLIAGSTIDSFNPEQREIACFPNMPINYSAPVEVGTNYQIVLPIRKKSKMATNLPHNISTPSETTAKEIIGIEQLFNYQFLTVNDKIESEEFIVEHHVKYLIEFRFSGAEIHGREDIELLYDGIEDRMKVVIDKDIKEYIICLNFDEVVIDESNLFRLHGMIELNYPSSPIIIYNLPNATYQNLLFINEDFHIINSSLDYWNSKISTLVYNFNEVRGDRFNFCDVLFGASPDDFLYVNWLTSFATFNSTVIIKQKDMIEKFVDGKPFQVTYPNKGLLFYNKHSVLPFELILNGTAENTLFEQNTMVLLKNELVGGGKL